MKFLCSRAILRLADEEARERISIDAVRGVCPLRMIRREVDSSAPAAGLGASSVRTAGHLWEATEVEGNTVTSTNFCQPIDPPVKICQHSTLPVCDGCSLAVDQAAATTSVLGLSQGALAALMAPNSCPVVMPVLYALPAVSQPSY